MSILDRLSGPRLAAVDHPPCVVHIDVWSGTTELAAVTLRVSDGSLSTWYGGAVDEADVVGRVSLGTALTWVATEHELGALVPQTDDEYIIGRVGDLLLAAGLFESEPAKRARRLSIRERAVAALAGALVEAEALPHLESP